MNPADFHDPQAGRVVQAAGGYVAFVPDPTARQAIVLLEGEGLLEEISGRSWRRLYLARPILEAIENRPV